MKYDLSDRILRELSFLAHKYSVTKIVLFGSRARGTNTERSDIDIAVYGGKTICNDLQFVASWIYLYTMN